MRSKKVTLAIPHRLWDAFEKHAVQVGYTDARQLLVWSAFYSLLVQKPHVVTGPIAQMPLEVQDLFIDEVVGAFERGEFKRGSFFEHILAEVVQRCGVNLPQEVVRTVVADTVRNRRKPAR